MSGSDEPALVRSIAGGDERAFKVLYDRHSGPAYRTVLRMLGGRTEAAEDVAQEAWRRAIRGIAGFQFRSSFRTWLTGIAVRCALETLRREGRLKRLTESETAPPRSLPGDAEGRIDLARAFEAMPDGYRTVLVLHVEGYTHEEIAKHLGISAGTSKSQLSRARAWLRRALGRSLEGAKS